MKCVFITCVFVALAGSHATGMAAETPPAAKPMDETAEPANTESLGKADEETDAAAKKPVQMKVNNRIKMDEPMDTPMAKAGMMKEDMKKGMMKKDAEMKEMIREEEEEMK